MDESHTATARPLTVERLREWVRGAKANARTTYGHGPNASTACSKAMLEEVQALTAKGFVTPHTIRLGAERAPLQIVQRTHRPAPRVGAL